MDTSGFDLPRGRAEQGGDRLDATVPLPVPGPGTADAGGQQRPQDQTLLDDQLRPTRPHDHWRANGSRGGPRPVTGRRWLRRAAWLTALALTILLVAFAALMLATPSVGNAWSVARSEAAAHRAPYPGPAVPARFAHALIATEDHRFGSALEPGFDPFAVARVLASGLTGGGDQGGATLYQQLAKMLYDPGSGGLKLYAYELALGIKLRFSYTSEQILRMYSAVVYFGHGYYGLDKASCGYFGRAPARLSWPQAAVLAGLVQAPTDYDPLRHPALARARESHVLTRLVATGVLTARQASAALAVPMRRLVAGAGGCAA